MRRAPVKSARMTAAAGRKYGMEPVLVLEGDDPGHRMGNLLLDSLFGAGCGLYRGQARRIGDERGRRASTGIRQEAIHGAFGRLHAVRRLRVRLCAQEIVSQCKALDIEPKAVYLAAGSLGTLAGLLLGRFIYRASFEVLGVAVGRTAETTRDRGVDLTLGAAELLLASSGDKPFTVPPDLTAGVVRPSVRVLTGQVGPGYGIPTPECLEAITLLARTEGILTDPVYTGKALAELVAAVRRGDYGEDDAVIFLHTGGVPADFAYGDVFLTKEEPK